MEAAIPQSLIVLTQQARERLSQVPGGAKAAEARLRGEMEATAEKQADAWPDSEQKRPDSYPNVPGEGGLEERGRVQILLFYPKKGLQQTRGPQMYSTVI